MNHHSRPRRYEPRCPNSPSFGNNVFLSTDDIPGRSQPELEGRENEEEQGESVYAPAAPRRICTCFHVNEPDLAGPQGSPICANSILLSGEYIETSVLPDTLLQCNYEFLWPRPEPTNVQKITSPLRTRLRANPRGRVGAEDGRREHPPDVRGVRLYAPMCAPGADGRVPTGVRDEGSGDQVLHDATGDVHAPAGRESPRTTLLVRP